MQVILLPLFSDESVLSDNPQMNLLSLENLSKRVEIKDRKKKFEWF